MRPFKYALVAIVLFAVLGAFGATSEDSPDDDELDRSSVTSPQLHDCTAMQYGDRRANCVRRLQELLRTRGAPMNVTGFYLDQTTRYVQQFQAANGLRQDGVVDSRTLHALVTMPTGSAAWDLRRECVSLARGAEGNPDSQGRCVTELRNRLAARGVSIPRGDRFDTDTEKAVRAFQDTAGLPAIGVAGPLTKQALYGSRPGTQPDPTRTCTLRYCAIYLSRGVTTEVAGLIPDGDLARAAAATAIAILACRKVKAIPALDLVCEPATSLIVDRIFSVFERAAKQRACLVVRIGFPPGKNIWWPLSLGVDAGPNCRD